MSRDVIYFTFAVNGQKPNFIILSLKLYFPLSRLDKKGGNGLKA